MFELERLDRFDGTVSHRSDEGSEVFFTQAASGEWVKFDDIKELLENFDAIVEGLTARYVCPQNLLLGLASLSYWRVGCKGCSGRKLNDVADCWLEWCEEQKQDKIKRKRSGIHDLENLRRRM